MTDARVGEEFVLGYIPSRDGSDYDETFEGPTWNDLIDALDEEGIDGAFEIMFVGMGIYDASASDTGIGGVSAIVDARDIEKVRAAQSWEWAIPSATPNLAQTLLRGLLPSTPEHITGIVIGKFG